jgi:hypothetical protein
MRDHRDGSNRGFLLVEALIALALVLLAMLLGLALIMEQGKVLARLEAHRQALLALEATHEMIRAGFPIAPGVIAAPGFDGGDGPAILLRMDETETPGLFHVVLQARYDVSGQTRFRSLETLVWRP